MDRSVALAILGLSPGFTTSEIEDAYEFKLFEFKQFFLTRLPQEKLWKIKLNKLEKLGMAYGLLNFGNHGKKNIQLPLDIGNSDDFLPNYSKVLSDIKLKTSQATSAEQLYAFAENRIELERRYAKWFSNLLNDLGLNFKAKDIPSSTTALPWNLLQRLKNGENQLSNEELGLVEKEWKRVEMFISDQRDW
jgi:hypothetical protein